MSNGSWDKVRHRCEGVHDRDSLLVEIGGRLLSILHQMCDIIEFHGADYRHAGDHPARTRC